MAKRRNVYKKHWERLILMHGTICVYCGDQPATEIDHVIPLAYVTLHDIENLRPTCSWCNLLASDKVFESFYDKRAYILQKRQKKMHGRHQRTSCGDCWVPYQYPRHSPSPLLCAECYDEEYDTSNRTKAVWRSWLTLLEEAEIEIALFRDFKRRSSDIQGRRRKILIFGSIIQERYEQFPMKETLGAGGI